MRSAGEKIARRELSGAGVAHAATDFFHAIGLVREHSLLSARAVGYLHTIRTLGNLAAHPSGEELSDRDVRIAAFALASVIEEVIDPSSQQTSTEARSQ